MGYRSVISGLTIRNGSAFTGGGIYCNWAYFTIRDSVIENCISYSSGGGIALSGGSNPKILNCLIIGNEAFGPQTYGNGGGISTNGSHPYLQRCKILNNVASSMGGGFCSQENSGQPQDFSDCEISGNSAVYGGGIFNDGAVPSMDNCVVSDNSAVYGGGLYINHCNPLNNLTIVNNTADWGGGIYKAVCETAILTNCIIWGNQANIYGDSIYAIVPEQCEIYYSVVQGGWPGIGNLNTDPLLVPGPLGNFYLSSIAAGQASNSPCIDSGSAMADSLFFTSRIGEIPESVYFDSLTTQTNTATDEGIIDMGYHYQPITATPTPGTQEVPATTPTGIGILLLGLGVLLHYRR